jgi:rod shape-determining protein MreD
VNRKSLIAVGKVVLLLVIGALLQTLIVSRVSVLGVTADLFLIFTVVIAMSKGSLYGAISGFVAGLLADIAFMQPLGIRCLIYVLVGYFAGMLVLRFGSVGPWAVFLMSIGASFSAQIVFGIFQFIFGPRGGFGTILGLQILPEAILDGLVAIPVYVLLIHLRILPEPHKQPAAGKAATE